MDILYETVLMPKPPKIRGTSPTRHKEKKQKTKHLMNILMKLNIFPNDRMRRDSTATAITTLSDVTGSVESVNSRERRSLFSFVSKKSECSVKPLKCLIYKLSVLTQTVNNYLAYNYSILLYKQ